MPDPIGLDGEFNLYAYVKSLLTYIDPLELTCCSIKPSKNFKDHFIRHKDLLKKYLDKKYPKRKVNEGLNF
ncbi:hypothetical protein B6C99_12155 [Gilliamella sp. N-G2]|nr:hypothetical protein B6C99_12155 [Gilliamella sp. N-G2]OTQ78445.1 hypothetical protein B6D23_08680 [Gilliamella sp. N-W3]